MHFVIDLLAAVGILTYLFTGTHTYIHLHLHRAIRCLHARRGVSIIIIIKSKVLLSRWGIMKCIFETLEKILKKCWNFIEIANVILWLIKQLSTLKNGHEETQAKYTKRIYFKMLPKTE